MANMFQTFYSMRPIQKLATRFFLMEIQLSAQKLFFNAKQSVWKVKWKEHYRSSMLLQFLSRCITRYFRNYYFFNEENFQYSVLSHYWFKCKTKKISPIKIKACRLWITCLFNKQESKQIAMIEKLAWSPIIWKQFSM